MPNKWLWDWRFNRTRVRGTINSHDHLVVMKTLNNDGISGESVDMRKVMTSFLDTTKTRGMVVTASDAGPDENALTADGDKTFDVEWNESLQQWVTKNEQRSNEKNPWLIYDRSVQKTENRTDGTTPTYWIAWHEDPAQRYRVAWVHQLDDGQIMDAWLTLDRSKKWNISSRTWENI